MANIANCAEGTMMPKWNLKDGYELSRTGREEHMPESRRIFRFKKMFDEIKKKPNKTPRDVYWKVMGDEAGE